MEDNKANAEKFTWEFTALQKKDWAKTVPMTGFEGCTDAGAQWRLLVLPQTVTVNLFKTDRWHANKQTTHEGAHPTSALRMRDAD